MGIIALAACQSVDWPWAGASAPNGAAEPAAATTTNDAYPNLHTVPPRPKLSYSVQQRRAIVDGLVADREMARYTDQVVRYRSGQSSLPPPPAPPTVVAEAVPEGLIAPIEPAPEATEPGEPAGPSDRYGGDAFTRQFDEDTLGSFVDQLARGSDAETPPAAEPPEPPPDESGDEGSGFFDWLGGLFGQTKAKPAEPAPAPGADAAAAPAPAAPSTPDRVSAAEGSPETAIEAAWVDHAAPLSASRGVPDRSAPPDEDARATVAQAQAASPTPVPQLRPSAASPAPPDPGATGIAVGAEGVAIGAERAAIGADRAALPAPPPEAPRPVLVLFEPGSASLPPGVDGRLEQMLATAKAQGAVIRIEGEAAGAPALALDRARSVALGLMRLGASARDLQMTLAPGASADQARLVLTGPAAAR